MLYDQAQLLSVYSKASMMGEGCRWEHVIEDIMTYTKESLLDPAGAFYCAEDADSLPSHGGAQKREGAFAVWEEEEVRKIVGPERADVFCSHFGVQSGGNVKIMQDPHGEMQGQNVLSEIRKVPETAALFEIPMGECLEMIEEGKRRLAIVRGQRPRPDRDDKILTSWNSLMISGLCCAYQATKSQTALSLAEKALLFIHSNMVTEEGELLRSYRQGPADIKGFAEDYAYLVSALLELWNATLNPFYQKLAIKLQSKQDDLFWDTLNGGYYTTKAGDPQITIRLKDCKGH